MTYRPQPYTPQQVRVLANVRRLRPVRKYFPHLPHGVVCFLLDKRDVSSTVWTLKRRGAIAWFADETIPRLTPEGAERLRKLMAAETSSFEAFDGSKVRVVKRKSAELRELERLASLPKNYVEGP